MAPCETTCRYELYFQLTKWKDKKTQIGKGEETAVGEFQFASSTLDVISSHILLFKVISIFPNTTSLILSTDTVSFLNGPGSMCC